MHELCHYTSAEKAVQILSSQYFMFGHLQNSNDPFENLKKRYSISYVIPGSLQIFMDNLFDYTNTELSYASFGSGNELIPCGEHWTMWAHYGKLHTGVCFVFDQASLLEQVSEKIHKYEAGLINYTNNLLINPVHFENRIDKSVISILIEFKESLLFSKHKAWSSENEYRIVVFESSFKIPINNCLIKVIYGPEIENKNLSKIKSLLKSMEFAGPSGKLGYALGGYAKPSIFFFHDLKTIN
jgi:hypothetical protein